MAAEIGQSATAKNPPIPPGERQVFRTVGSIRDRAEPELVMQLRRNRGSGLRAIFSTITGINPNMHLADFSNGATLDQFDHSAGIGAGMDLGSDLRDELFPFAGLHHRTAFGNGACQGLLAI